MKRLLTTAILLLLVGCAGSGDGTGLGMVESKIKPAGGVLPLQLETTRSDGAWLVILRTPAALDLYQIAGSLVYDSARCRLLDVRPGGGLGDPDQTYFAWGESRPGSIDFAYTRRFYGPGVNGAAGLLIAEFTTDDGAAPSGVRLETGPATPVARDSGKQALEVRLPAGVRQ